MCYLLKPSNTSHFVTLFLAHEDVVVGFVIFHTKLSTPSLQCFICSSLILQGSWSDHYNKKKKKEKKALLHGMRKLGGTRRIRLAMVCERKGGEECQSIKSAYKCFINNLEPLSTCLVWNIARTPLPFVDRNNHLSKQFLSLFYK
jgi:hypothetical protein